MSRPVTPEAGYRIETSARKGNEFAKLCGRCGCRIERRKTYCGPCYDVRLEENIAANRHKYRSRVKA